MYSLRFQTDLAPVTLDDGEPITTQHMTTARRRAIQQAEQHGRAVEIVVAGKARTVIQPNGRAEAPEGVPSALERCKSPAACFCPVCREERREARARTFRADEAGRRAVQRHSEALSRLDDK